MSNEEPSISAKQVEILEKMYPPKDFKPGDRMDDIMFYAGKRAVILYLRSLIDRKELI